LGDFSLRLPKFPPVIFGTGPLFYTGTGSSGRGRPQALCPLADWYG
jgi:hypothetical protein